MPFPNDQIWRHVMNYRSHLSIRISTHTKSIWTSRFREMLHSSSRGRPTLQHPALSLLLDGVLRLWAEASGSGPISSPPPGPQGASLTRQHLRRRGQRRRAALRTAGPGGRMLPGLSFNGPPNVQDAGRRRAVCGCKTEATRCGDQVWKWLNLL